MILLQRASLILILQACEDGEPRDLSPKTSISNMSHLTNLCERVGECLLVLHGAEVQNKLHDSNFSTVYRYQSYSRIMWNYPESEPISLLVIRSHNDIKRSKW